MTGSLINIDLKMNRMLEVPHRLSRPNAEANFNTNLVTLLGD